MNTAHRPLQLTLVLLMCCMLAATAYGAQTNPHSAANTQTSRTSPPVHAPPPIPVASEPQAGSRACPHTLAEPSTKWGAARKSVVPSGVRVFVICHYTFRTSPKPVHLLETRLVRAHRTVQALADDLNTLPPQPPGTPAGVAPMCAADRGPSVSLWAQYKSHAPLEISVDETGCRYVTNGYAGGSAAGSGLIPLISTLLNRS